jgi:hypothetical protein
VCCSECAISLLQLAEARFPCCVIMRTRSGKPDMQGVKYYGSQKSITDALENHGGLTKFMESFSFDDWFSDKVRR